MAKRRARRREPIRVKESEFVRLMQEDTNPDTSYLSPQELAAYKRGEFVYRGVQASVELRLPIGKSHSDPWVVHEVTSPGLWGIEDDGSSNSVAYMQTVFRDECVILRAMLEALGVVVDP